MGDGDAHADDAEHVAMRAIAFYLPQFYPVPDNDDWWGQGFTEWTNVVQGDPLFDGHYQPREPADLGYYDLRVPEVREAQAALARAHGLEGFAYWHYWFHGRRVLDRPFQEVLDSDRPDFGFCLSWANETWSRRWHGTGEAQEVLIEQTYSPEDDQAHVRWLLPAFSDPRYLRVDGRPIFLIYRPFDLPDARRTTDTFRQGCLRAGLSEPYLIGINAHRPREDTRPLGFDITLDFQPQLSAVPGPTDPGLKLYDYAIATGSMRSQPRDFPTLPCAVVSWDNTSRRGMDGIVFINSTPAAFGQNLAALAQRVIDRPPEERLLFVNAWNEWAEGNHLEPDARFGVGWLEALRGSLTRLSISPRP
jgi:lipopolysaccharide biosynthesis protein